MPARAMLAEERARDQGPLSHDLGDPRGPTRPIYVHTGPSYEEVNRHLHRTVLSESLALHFLLLSHQYEGFSWGPRRTKQSRAGD